MNAKLHHLIAATHTPFSADGQLNLSAIEKLAAHFQRNGITTVFVGGSTGEYSSLTVDERMALVGRWSQVTAGTSLRLVVHVGSNCLAEARALAIHAHKVGAVAISSLAPNYFKPTSIDALVDCCAEIAEAAPGAPFYYYDIPSMTNVHFSMPELLSKASEQIPSFAGIKFSNADLAAYQRCLHQDEGRFDIPWGIDEYLLAALALGARGGIGSSYNFAAPIYHRMLAAFSLGDPATARAEQYRSAQLIELLNGFGYMAAAKATMGFLGIDVGPARLPIANLTPEQSAHLRASLERLGFFDWVRT